MGEATQVLSEMRPGVQGFAPARHHAPSDPLCNEATRRFARWRSPALLYTGMPYPIDLIGQGQGQGQGPLGYRRQPDTLGQACGVLYLGPN